MAAWESKQMPIAWAQVQLINTIQYKVPQYTRLEQYGTQGQRQAKEKVCQADIAMLFSDLSLIHYPAHPAHQSGKSSTCKLTVVLDRTRSWSQCKMEIINMSRHNLEY